MSSNEELVRVNAEIKQLQDQHELIQNEFNLRMKELSKKKHSIGLNSLLESNLLRNSEWEVRLRNSKIVLDLVASPSISSLNDLRILFDASWHCSFDLNEALLEFDDNQVSLVFIKLSEMIQFAKLYELKVSLDSLNKEVIRLKLLEFLRDVIWTDLISVQQS